MKIKYVVNNIARECEVSNEDIQIDAQIKDNRYVYTIKAKNNITLLSVKDTIHFHVVKTDLYFINGYQSWTTTHVANVSFKEKNIHKFKILKDITLQPYGDYSFYSTKKDRLHSYDVFYSKGLSEIFIFNNNYKNAFLVIEVNKKLDRLNFISDVEGKRIKAGEEWVVFDYERYDTYDDGIAAFNERFPHRDIPRLFGYTSWYNYYQDINEEIILRDLKALDDRFDLFQIDDGYETFVGDWLDVDKKKFPNGLEGIVKTIHKKKLKAGLWLAPFVAEKESKLFKEHPEYFKKDNNGNPVKVGVNWSGQYALDLSNKDVLEYIKKCLLHYVEIGFDFFKLDFIYAPAYVHDGVTHAEASEFAYKFLKDVLKDKIILGCGATLSSVINNFDYVRVGPDVSLVFDDVKLMRLLHRERPSTKNTLRNTVYRSLFNERWFANDPDVFLLRDDKLSMSKEQRYSLVMLNAIFGHLLLTSDDIGTYDDKKKELLARALDIFRNRESVSYRTNGRIIHVRYKLNGVFHDFDYNSEKGIITHER